MPHPLHAFVPDPAGFDPNASVISKPFELDDSADLRREIAEAEHTEWVIDAAARRALALLGQPSAALDAATDEALAVEVELALQQDAAKPDDVQLFPPAISQIDKDRAANARLLHKDDDINPQAPSDWDMDGQGVVEDEVDRAPYVPDFTIIPDALAKYAEADETADDFRKRLKRLWQRFGIADGENFPGGGEPLSGDEKITMREIDIVLNSDEGRNAGLLQWLQADERNT